MLLMLWIVGCVHASGLAVAQSIRVNRTLPRGIGSAGGGDVLGFQLSGAGWAVYLADDSLDDVFELFSTPLDGSGPPRRLNAPFAPGRGLIFASLGFAFAISAPGDRVVYIADQETDEAFDLWSVPIDGSAPPLRINGVFAAGSEVMFDLLVSSDGGRVVYRADPNTNGLYELWSAPIDAGAPPVRLNAPGHGLESNGRFVLSPDGAWVVYVDDQATPGVTELWRAPIDGSAAAIRLHAPLPAFADVCTFSDSCFRISPDSTRVVYRADASTDGANELWSVPLDASASPVRISDPLASGRSIQTFEIAGDSSGVLYRVNQNAVGKVELYWAALDGAGPTVRLSGDLIPEGDVGEARLSPDGHVAVFLADAAENDVVNLYSVPVDLSRPRLALNDPLVTGGGVQSFEIAADGSRVVYRANQELASFQDLWSVPTDRATGPVRLNPTLQGNGSGVQHYRIDPSGSWVAYSPETPNGLELWSVRIDGSAGPLPLQRAGRLTGAIGFSFEPFALTAARAVYLSDAQIDQRTDLWSRPLDGSEAALRIDQALPADPIVGDVASFLWTPDGAELVYQADQMLDEREGLFVARADDRPQPRTLWVPFYPGAPFGTRLSPDGRRLVWVEWSQSYQGVLRSAPLDGSQPPTELPSSPVRDFAISPDSERVVYDSLIYHHPPIEQLSSAPVDGQGGSTALHQLDGDGLTILRAVISSDSRRVVFLEFSQGVMHLRRAALRGPPAATLLETPVDRSIDRGFQLAADGARVVFVSDLEQAGVFQLYSVPLARDARRIGAPAWVRLNPPLGPDQDVDSAFRISPDGGRVVYVADQDVDEEYELFSVPIRGGPALQLSPALVGGGDVARSVPRPGGAPSLPQFELGPAGTWVVYRADQEADDVFELFRAPIDGSSAALRLHPALAPDGDVALLSARISPDGTSVVYAADELADEVLELFRAPIDGSSAPVLLSGPFVTDGDIWTRTDLGAWQSVALSPEGAHVVYLADQDQDEVIELYAVPLDGSQPAIRINGPLVAGGDVKSLAPDDAPPFRISPGGRQVAYLADQEVDEVVELFLTAVDLAPFRITGPARPR